MTAAVLVRTTRFADDLAALLDDHGFRVELIFPADDPGTAVVSGHGIRLRLEATDDDHPIVIALPTGEATGELPGGSRLASGVMDAPSAMPDNQPSLVVTRNDAASEPGRAGMRYRDLLPDRWGGRFISSHITIPDGGPVPDYVHYHRIRFQMIFVKEGWVRVVYEDQGEPFVMERGDCVVQPPEIRHRVLESSPGLEVIEIGCPAEHPTLADWDTELPTGELRTDRDFGGQHFIRHIADGAPTFPWRLDGWKCRDTGIGDATHGLAGARVATPDTSDTSGQTTRVAHGTEFCQLVVLRGEVTFDAEGNAPERLGNGDAVAVPGGVPYRLIDPTPDCEVLDVTLPATVELL